MANTQPTTVLCHLLATPRESISAPKTSIMPGQSSLPSPWITTDAVKPPITSCCPALLHRHAQASQSNSLPNPQITCNQSHNHLLSLIISVFLLQVWRPIDATASTQQISSPASLLTGDPTPNSSCRRPFSSLLTATQPSPQTQLPYASTAGVTHRRCCVFSVHLLPLQFQLASAVATA